MAYSIHWQFRSIKCYWYMTLTKTEEKKVVSAMLQNAHKDKENKRAKSERWSIHLAYFFIF